jgi:two-component system LytT family response regulator
MRVIKAIIADDEPFAIEVIQELLNRFAPDVFILATAKNGLDALNAILHHKPDLLFLDVDMPLMNGLEMIEKLPYKNLQIIFTTGSSNHALKAIKLEATDYLLKPIDPFEFAIAIEKVRTRLNNNTEQDLRTQTIKIQFPIQDQIIFLNEDEILHIEGMGSYSKIKIVNKQERLVVSKSIGQIEEKLPPTFFRCHNSHIINLNYVTRFIKKDGFFVLLKNDTQVEVSRRTKDELLNRLKNI